MKNPGKQRYKIELTASQIGRIYVALDVRVSLCRGMSEMQRRYRDVWRSIERDRRSQKDEVMNRKEMQEFVNVIVAKFLEERHEVPGFQACVICGVDNPYNHVGVFIPTEMSLLAPPKGKQRFIPYSICRVCIDLPDDEKADRAEQAMTRMKSDGRLLTWRL